MTSKPEVINLTSSSSENDDSFPPFRYPYQDIPRPKKSPFLPSSEDDSVVDPSESSRDSDDSTDRQAPIFNRLVEEKRARAGKEKVQSTQSKHLRSTLVLGTSSHGGKGKGKKAVVKGKDKGGVFGKGKRRVD